MLVFNDDETVDFYYMTTVGLAKSDDNYGFRGTYTYSLCSSFSNYKIQTNGETFEIILSEENEPQKIKIEH